MGKVRVRVREGGGFELRGEFRFVEGTGAGWVKVRVRADY